MHHRCHRVRGAASATLSARRWPAVGLAALVSVFAIIGYARHFEKETSSPPFWWPDLSPV